QIMRPDSIPIILENIGLGDLQSDAAQTLYMRYAELESQGILADFDRMILEFDDPAMKNLLVGLSESAGKKLQQDLDVEMALRELLESFLRRQTDAELRQQQRSLDSHDLDDDKKMELLLDLLKRRQELA
ncbi:MAG: hypothetical protein KDA87_12455, partial [Planctomycetales bacterium]|nr:hypothetical protein [Planctomycetales bacterium]